MKQPLIVAHRGASKHEYENTLASFAKAIDLGADYIECDVRKTVDKIFILHHNSSVGRLRIKNSKYRDLRVKAKKRNYDIPTLFDLVSLAKGKIKLDIEIKEKGSEQEIVGILKNNLPYRGFVITSFHDSSIRSVKSYDKNVTCGLICGFFGSVTKINRPVTRAIKAKADFLVLNHKLLNIRTIREAKQSNLPIWVWTVNNPKKIEKLMRTDNMQAIITDVPDVATNLRKY
jgi:glycerophosphoryl diester phosphodiesterase